jgi:hypothetical protein
LNRRPSVSLACSLLLEQKSRQRRAYLSPPLALLVARLLELKLCC